MKSLWQDHHHSDCPLTLRVTTSRLLGADSHLVLHGGGNTSVKITEKDPFGDDVELLYVKGSGWDLGTIEAPGFAPVRMDTLLKMAELPELSDMDMVKIQRSAMTEPSAPNPSVEAILHAILPFRFVDHTHADAVVTLSNTPGGEARIRDLYGDSVVIVPYVMPGFILAKAIQEQIRDLDWSGIKGMVLMNHGVFTFDDEAKVAYENMIEIVHQAEQELTRLGCEPAAQKAEGFDPLELAAWRKEVSTLRGAPQLASISEDEVSVAHSLLGGLEKVSRRGTLTPDHVIRTKPWPLLMGGDPSTGAKAYADEYQGYFDRHAGSEHTRLDPAPRWGLWAGKGRVHFGKTGKEMNVCSDILDHTLPAIQAAERIESWRPIEEKDLFEMEYWSLEQAKLGKSKGSSPFRGKVAMVSGAASGIGKGCVEALLARGVAVVGLDIDPAIEDMLKGSESLGIVCDVTDPDQLDAALKRSVARFGGLDILVGNAGIFPPSETIESTNPDTWERSLQLNLTSHQRLLQKALPLLKLGFDPAVVFIASKNVPAPGPGVSAYSVAKAGLQQLARVAALELAPHGIRVNTVHPNAVFDTGIWTEQVLEKRAAHYGLSIDEYKRNNLLKTEITSRDVGELVVDLTGPTFAKTTGAQVPIDGGNERVI